MTFDVLKQNISGRLILPSNSTYNEARKVYNAMIDKQPAAILKCSNEQDIVEGILFAGENKLEVSVKGGGHNGAELAMSDDGLVLDLSEMNTVKVDPEKRTAVVEGGCTLGDVDKATHVHGLALPMGINSTTGIGGLTLGGGLGYLTRKAGLAIDHLIKARVVLATGEVVVCNTEFNTDLLWALRGGGGNFGVVVSFTFSLIQLKKVYAGPMFWPFEKAKKMIRFYDRFTKNVSNDLYGFFALMTIPPSPPFPENLYSKKICCIVWCYTGSSDKVEEIFKPVRDFEPPVFDMTGEMSVPEMNSMFDPFYPKGMQWYWKAHYATGISDASIETDLKFCSNFPSLLSTMHLYPIDGAAHEVKAEETAWVNRDQRWVKLMVGIDPDPANKEKITHWARQYYDASIPYTKEGAYVNFMMKEGDEKVKAAYGKNYKRLAVVKKKYDPDNFFRINQNIKPAK